MLTNIVNTLGKNFMAKQGVALACCGVLLWAGVVRAEEIAKTEFNNRAVIITADKLENGYCRDFLMKVERESVPYLVEMGLNGGYWPELKTVQLKPAEKQLFFAARQGGENATTEYRIFGERKGKITSIFSGRESFGLIQKATLTEKQLHVQLWMVRNNPFLWRTGFGKRWRISTTGVMSPIIRACTLWCLWTAMATEFMNYMRPNG